MFTFDFEPEILWEGIGISTEEIFRVLYAAGIQY